MRGLFLFRNPLLERARRHSALGNRKDRFHSFAEPRERFRAFDHLGLGLHINHHDTGLGLSEFLAFSIA